ncbi:MAG: tetratricopeptide repeat protein [Planctomycetota bacterium]
MNSGSGRAWSFLSNDSWRSHPFTFLLLRALLLVLLTSGSGCRLLNRSAPSAQILASRQLNLRGTDALQRGHWEEAELNFQRAIQHCPTDERSRAGHAEALWQRGEWDLAIRQMEEGVNLSGGDPEMLVRLGEMRLSRNDRDGASICVERALRTKRQLASAWALQGDVLRASGDLEAALGSYHRALQVQTNYCRVELAIAEVYQQQQRPQRALSTLDALSEQYPPHQIPAQVHYLRGITQHSLARYDEAAVSLSQAVQAGTVPAACLIQLADCQVKLGDLVAARATVAEGQRRFPGDVTFLKLRANLEQGQPSMAALSSPGM